MTSAASGMTLSLGSDGPPTCYADIELADAFLFVGSNAADCHPVIVRPRGSSGSSAAAGEVRRRRPAPHRDRRRRRRCTCRSSPGTDLALLNGLLRLLRDCGQARPRRSSPAHTEGWDELNALLDDYPPQRVADDLRHRATPTSSPPRRSSTDSRAAHHVLDDGRQPDARSARSPATRSSTCTWRPARSASPAAARSA